jgi:hypothetical protein
VGAGRRATSALLKIEGWWDLHMDIEAV